MFIKQLRGNDMKDLTIENTKNISGGGITVWGAIGIATGVIFIIGVIDGFVRPLKCNG